MESRARGRGFSSRGRARVPGQGARPEEPAVAPALTRALTAGSPGLTKQGGSGGREAIGDSSQCQTGAWLPLPFLSLRAERMTERCRHAQCGRSRRQRQPVSLGCRCPLSAFSRLCCVSEGRQSRSPSSSSLKLCSLALSPPQNRLGVSCPPQIACTAAAASVCGRYRRGGAWQPLAAPAREGLLRRFPGPSRPPDSA